MIDDRIDVRVSWVDGKWLATATWNETGHRSVMSVASHKTDANEAANEAVERLVTLDLRKVDDEAERNDQTIVIDRLERQVQRLIGVIDLCQRYSWDNKPKADQFVAWLAELIKIERELYEERHDND